VKKLALTYYRKLDHLLDTKGRFRELPSWRKAFKREWKRCAATPITAPLNPKYRPDPLRWVCTCPSFSTSRFLICKHLVQSVHQVPARFFLEVTRNQNIPFWDHKALIPLDLDHPMDVVSNAATTEDGMTHSINVYDDSRQNQHEYNEDSSEEGDDINETAVSIGNGQTYRQQLTNHIHLLREFCDGLEYQLQFNDPRMLNSVERDGAGMLRLASHCLSRERRLNSTRGGSPTTWEAETIDALYYRTRPPPSDAHT
jgi:hypothetical protein